jgi:hypothetical protein
VRLPDNGSPVPVEFELEVRRFEEEPEASIDYSGPETALHQMPHVVGAPPAGPPPSPHATEAAPASPGMPFDIRGVVCCRPAPVSGSTRARCPIPASDSTRTPKVPRLAPTHTFSMQQHTFPVQQPMLIMMPPPTPIPHPPAGYDDWLQFYQGHKLQEFAAAQLERVSQLSLVNEGEYTNQDCSSPIDVFTTQYVPHI